VVAVVAEVCNAVGPAGLLFCDECELRLIYKVGEAGDVRLWIGMIISWVVRLVGGGESGMVVGCGWWWWWW